VKYLNIGIVAHVDAGKTSLTERLLYEAGAIGTLGSVERANTQTDRSELERRRGITINSTVVSFPLDDLLVNLIDTPGHPDFIAEVERSLRVLDAVVLVVSAVEGIQAQTRILMRTLHRLRIPTLLFVNKIDRAGAREDELLTEITAKLTPAAVPLNTVHDLGGPYAHPVNPRPDRMLTLLIETLAGVDDEFLAGYLDDSSTFDLARCWQELTTRVARAQVHPVLFGSAITGQGVPELLDMVQKLFPRRHPTRLETSRSARYSKSTHHPPGNRRSTCECSPGRWQCATRCCFTAAIATAMSARIGPRSLGCGCPRRAGCGPPSDSRPELSAYWSGLGRCRSVTAWVDQTRTHRTRCSPHPPLRYWWERATQRMDWRSPQRCGDSPSRTH
jgi:small GTP-binding protein